MYCMEVDNNTYLISQKKSPGYPPGLSLITYYLQLITSLYFTSSYGTSVTLSALALASAVCA